MSIVERENCRGCGAKELRPVLSLGNQHLTAFPESNHTEPLHRAPLDVTVCSKCSLVQLRHSVPGEWLYTWYGYRSGMNATMRAALQELADTASEIASLKSGDLVVDIGSNDGTLLRSYKTEGLLRVGFEPAENLAEDGRVGLDHLVEDYFSGDGAYAIASEFGKAKIISAIAMFYDLDDPLDFLLNVKHLLADDGIFVIQMNYLAPMLANNTFDNISHEHVCYYSLHTVLPLLNQAGLEVFDVSENDVNGGSFRIYCRHLGSRIGGEVRWRVTDMLNREANEWLGDPSTYLAFGERARGIREQLRAMVNGLRGRDKKLYVYGASTRGLVIMEYCGFGSNEFEGAAERNPEKWGRLYSGTGIPCVPEEEARSKADGFLVLPWHFAKEFVEREADFLRRGGKIIVPLPEPRLVEA